eukprot:symbB.v1.2.023390.t1/scaffold2138.1/size88104/2
MADDYHEMELSRRSIQISDMKQDLDEKKDREADAQERLAQLERQISKKKVHIDICKGNAQEMADKAAAEEAFCLQNNRLMQQDEEAAQLEAKVLRETLAKTTRSLEQAQADAVQAQKAAEAANAEAKRQAEETARGAAQLAELEATVATAAADVESIQEKIRALEVTLQMEKQTAKELNESVKNEEDCRWCNETLDAATFEDFLDGGGPPLALGLGAWLVYGLSVTGHMIMFLMFRVKISISLLKRCSFHDIKDATKNAWTNIGLTTSLVMTTIIGALIEGHEITPQGFCLNHLDVIHVRQTYVAFCVACLFANLNCIIYCVLNLFYWDSLSKSDAIAFLNQNPQVLGETVIYMVESYVLFVGAVGTWIYGTYGFSCLSGIFLPFAATASVNLSVVWLNLDRFKPRDVKVNRKSHCGSKDRLRWIQVMQAISEHPQAESPQAQMEEETREKREADQADQAEPDASVPPTVSVKADDCEATNQCEVTNQSPSAQDWNTQKLSILVSPGRPGPTLKPGPLEEKQQRTQLECDRLSHLLESLSSRGKKEELSKALAAVQKEHLQLTQDSWERRSILCETAMN